MDNPETLATLDAQDTGPRQTTQHGKLKRWATCTPPKTGSEIMCSCSVSWFCFLQDTNCYSYIELSHVKVLSDGEIKTSTKN
jgi:hypothetical protein